MSMPAIRTALRDADMRVTSPSSTERDQRGQLAHPVEAHQRLAAGLAARELAQLALQRSDLALDRVDHRQRDLDPFARVGGKIQSGRGTRGRWRWRSLRRAGADAVVIQGASGCAAATACAHRSASCAGATRERHWRTCSGGIHASGSRPRRAARGATRASWRSVFARRLRPRNARVSTGSARCATAPARSSASSDKQPARARLHRDMHLTAREPRDPLRHGRRRRADPPTHHLPGRSPARRR